MANQGHNEGVRLLDDFICEAIHTSDAPTSAERRPGRNEDLRIVEELVFEIPANESKLRDIESSPIHLNPPMQRLAEELAGIVAFQAEPVGVMALFQQKVISQINAIQGSARASAKQ